MSPKGTNSRSPLINKRYQVIKRLGEGGMGKVLLVEDLLDREQGRRVALKLLTLEEKSSALVLSWFKREFKTLSMLRHPGLASVYDFGRDREKGYPFYTSQYVEGKELFAATRELSLEAQVDALIKITQALDYIHAKGVLHNDLKSGNIMMESLTQSPKILDFGLSFPLAAHNKLEGFHGTPSYAAPEIIRGEPASFLTDLFALGMVFYKILSGRLPPQGKYRSEIFQANLEGKFPSPRSYRQEIPEALERLVLKLLAVNPEERPQSAAQVLASLSLVNPQSKTVRTTDEAFVHAEGSELIGRTKILRTLQAFIRHRLPEAIAKPMAEGETSSGFDFSREPIPFLGICGGAGLGKTALLGQLKRHYQLLDLPFFFSSCQKNDPIFFPWRRLLTELEGIHTSPALQAFFKKTAMREAADFSDLDQVGFFLQVESFLEAAFSQQPFILAIDQIEQADELTLGFLEHLTRTRATSGKHFPPLVLASSSREILSDQALWLSLDAFTREDTRNLLRQMLVGSNPPETLVDQVHQQSGGNPYFVREIIRQLIVAGKIQRQRGEWKVEEIGEVHIPASLQNLLKQRIARLHKPEHSLAGLAAIYGTDFTIDQMASLTGESPAVLTPQLEELEKQEIFRRGSAGYWAFSQGLVAEVMRLELSPRQCELNHQRCAAFLERQRPKPWELLTRHYAEGNQPEKACQAALESAEEAKRLFAPKRALEFYQLALLQARKLEADREREVQALAGLAEVLWSLGESDQSLAVYQEILEVARVEHDIEVRGKALRALGIARRNQGKYAEAIGDFEQAIAELGRRNPLRRAAFLAQLALVHHRAGNQEKAQELSQAAQDLVAQGGKQSAGAIPVLLALVSIFKETGRINDTVALNEQVLEIALRLEDRKNTATARHNLGALAALRGDYADARSLLTENMTLCRKMGDAIRLCNGLYSLGKLEFFSGNYRKASVDLQEGLQLAKSIGDLQLIAGIEIALAHLETSRGNYELATRTFQEARQSVERGKSTKLLPYLEQGHANLFLLTGKYREAEEVLSRFLKQTDEKNLRFYLELLSVELDMTREKFARAEKSLQRVHQEYAILNADMKFLLAVTEAQVLQRLNKIQDAAKILQQVLTQKKKIFDRVLVARAQLLSLQVEFELERDAKGQVALQRTAQEVNEAIGSLESPELMWRSFFMIAQIKRNAGEMGPAFAALKRAEDTLLRLAAQLSEQDAKLYLSDSEKQLVFSQRSSLAKSPEFALEELNLLRMRCDKLMRLVSLNEQLASGWQNRSRLLDLILDVALELLHAKRGFVVLKESHDWSIVAARQDGKSDWKPEKEWSRSIVEEVFRSARPKIFLDAGGEPALQDSKSVTGLRLRSVLCVPLRRGTDLLGVLYVDDDRVQARFGKSEEDLLQALSNQAVLALTQGEREETLVKNLEETTTELRRMRALALEQHKVLEWKYSYENIVGGKDPAMRNVFQLLDRVVGTHATVLILGESGTGKELVAQAIHYNGPRKGKPFVSINCAGLNPTLLESELFGHIKGAFTGAEQDREGLLVMANEGTFFLDEIGDMPLEVQAKLLRVLQDGEVKPLGSDQVQKVDVRFIAATHKPLEDLVSRGEFRQDFYYRLNVVQINLPPLRERREDMDLILDSFLKKIAQKMKRKVPQLTQSTRNLLHTYSWPGNIRELANLLESVMAMSRRREIRERDLPDYIRQDGKKILDKLPDFETAKEEGIKTYLANLMQQTRGNISEASRTARMHRRSMYRLLRRYGLLEDDEK